MALYYFIRSLTPWLADAGARRGDFLVDRLTEPQRYLLMRVLPSAGETTGHLLAALADGNAEQVGDLSGPRPFYPPLRVVSGDLP